VHDDKGVLVAVDDARLNPLWQTASNLDVPVIIHVANPVAFFDALDHNSERWDELRAPPDWHFAAPLFPGFTAIIKAFARLVEKFPKLRFVGAHGGCYAENLAWVEALLQRCPNFYVDISARISELGRQPYSVRRFMEKFQDRILFGIDCGPQLETYHTYYRFLETDDEYFNYSWDGGARQGRWQIYGRDLPKPVLEKIYRRNASSLFGLGQILSDHVNLTDRLTYPAGALPILGEEDYSIRHDLDHFTGFMGVGATAQQEVAELIAGHMAVPVARCANPDA
jgi:predicted TIM-barrel fold metal-dependent hydrolase